MCVYIHAYTYIHIDMHTYTQTYTHTPTYTCVHTYPHIHMHTYTYTHIKGQRFMDIDWEICSHRKQWVGNLYTGESVWMSQWWDILKGDVIRRILYIPPHLQNLPPPRVPSQGIRVVRPTRQDPGEEGSRRCQNKRKGKARRWKNLIFLVNQLQII